MFPQSNPSTISGQQLITHPKQTMDGLLEQLMEDGE